MNAVESYLLQALQDRTRQDLFRNLKVLPPGYVDFSSNDFLGFAHDKLVDHQVKTMLSNIDMPLSGSGGSRLISGNSAYIEKLEADLAHFYQAESALIFNSGYDANLGLLSCIATRHDTILYDELCHASIIDGVRLSQASKKYKFKHNDPGDLRHKLKQAAGNVFIVVEAVYSMDGDTTLLHDFLEVAEAAGAALIVDEAHATGVFGPQGKGLSVDRKLESRIFARIHTFGKAPGCHGAIVAGSPALKKFLVNFARSFIYTTALPLHSLLAIDAAHHLLPDNTVARTRLWELIAYFDQKAEAYTSRYTFLKGQSAIQSVLTGGRSATKQLSEQLQSRQLDIRAILSPTVAAGKERLRICLHSFNTMEEINRIFEVLEQHA